MPLATVTMPTTWNLPSIPGIPSMLGSVVDAAVSTTAVGYAQSLLVSNAADEWGIFSFQGVRMLGSAHVTGVEYENSHSISTAPQEDGSFVSYNKVKNPYSARVLMICDGSETSGSNWDPGIQQIAKTITGQAGLTVRHDFLQTLESVASDTNFYTIRTPEFEYAKANIIGYRWRRTSESGVTMLTAEIAIQEVRNTATTAFQNTKTASGQVQQSSGTVQASTTNAVSSSEIASGTGWIV